MKNKKIIYIFITILVVVLLFAAILYSYQKINKSQQKISCVLVSRGTLDMKVYASGELRATKSAILVAPPTGSNNLQIIYLAKTGSVVKAGERVIEFDPSEQEYALEQSQSELDQAEQEITKSKAEIAVREAQDQVDLLKAKFAIRRAELEVARNELVSAIDAKKNLLALEEAQRKFIQLEKDSQSRAVSSKATLEALEAGRNRVQLSKQQAQKNIENLKVTASMDGLVSLRENTEAYRFMWGMMIPEYRVGDQTSPGRQIAEILDINQLEIFTKIDETDRGSLRIGQNVSLNVDSMPDETFFGKVKTVAELASRVESFSTNSAVRQFDATFSLDKIDTRFRPGITVQVTIATEPLKDVIYIPRQALFDKDGKNVVYVKKGNSFSASEVKVKFRTESHVVIEGINEGITVAMEDPNKSTKKIDSEQKNSAPQIGGDIR